jgi:hypothetical protein
VTSHHLVTHGLDLSVIAGLTTVIAGLTRNLLKKECNLLIKVRRCRIKSGMTSRRHRIKSGMTSRRCKDQETGACDVPLSVGLDPALLKNLSTFFVLCHHQMKQNSIKKTIVKNEKKNRFF